MLKRDFIMVQIEELGKMIALVIFNRNSNDGGRKNPELIQTVYTSLKLNKELLLDASPDELRRFLDSGDSCGLYRMEIAAKALLEESYLQADPGKTQSLRRAKELLEYLQVNDNTFSLERIDLIGQINGLLTA